MSLPGHRISPEMFGVLATGEGGTTLARRLTESEHSKHMVWICAVLVEARESGHQQYAAARDAYDLLCAAASADPAAARQVVRHPSVGAWALRTVLACHGLQSFPGAEPIGLWPTAAAAAIRCGLDAVIEVPAPEGLVMLPTLGMAMVPGDSARVRIERGRAHVGSVLIPENPFQDVTGWLGLRRLRQGRLDILVDDLDPFRMPSVNALPGRRSPSSAPTVESWKAVLADVWTLLDTHHKQSADEIAEAAMVIVPQTPEAGDSISTTSRETFGSIAMSLPTSPVTGAETLIHEMQHLKLGAVLDHVALTMPDDGSRYYAPWRNDPRPISGLLQGAYAYLGVTRFWRRQYEVNGDQGQSASNYARWREATAFATHMLLSSGRLTSAGAEFVGLMDHTLACWQNEFLPDRALAEARRLADAHRSRWVSAHGPVPAALHGRSN